MARLTRIDAVLIQAVIAGALSFAHLHDLAAAAGQAGWKAWAYPISVDLLLVAAWHRIRTLKAVGGPSGSAWCWFCIALAASLGANIATAGLLNLQDVPAWLRILVAGWPAAAFFGGTLLAHTTASTAADGNEDQEHEQVPAAAAPAAHVDRPEPDRFALPEPAAAADTNTTPAPAPVETNPPAESGSTAAPITSAPAVPGVPPGLVQHARKVADTHRAQTGHPIDSDTLRARLGLPASMADALAAQLA